MVNAGLKLVRYAVVHAAFWTFVVAGLLGCGAFIPKAIQTPLTSEQEHGYSIVWVQTYHRAERLPTVDWRLPTCSKPDGRVGIGSPYMDGSDQIQVGCVGGVTFSPVYVIVARSEGQRLSETGLAHEFLHAAQFYDGQSDPGHVGPDWAPTGLLGQANAALVAAGL